MPMGERGAVARFRSFFDFFCCDELRITKRVRSMIDEDLPCNRNQSRNEF